MWQDPLLVLYPLYPYGSHKQSTLWKQHNPHEEFLRYENWKDQFLKDYNKISSEEIKRVSENPKGMGLGPAVVKHIAELHGWRVKAMAQREGFYLLFELRPR